MKIFRLLHFAMFTSFCISCFYLMPHAVYSQNMNRVTKSSAAQNNATLPSPSNNIPVLSYHQIRDYKNTDSKNARVFILSVDKFAAQMRLLHENGYKPILPDQLLSHGLQNTSSSSKMIMLTFDDGTLSQYINALPLLDKYGYKAVFFIMTVSIDRPNYMTARQIKELSDKGHVIGCHTWDHHKVTEYNETDWKVQLEKPTNKLKEITGKSVKHFAYPFGLWNRAAVRKLAANGYATAFQLAGKRDSLYPDLTIPRILVDGNWSEQQFMSSIRSCAAH